MSGQRITSGLMFVAAVGLLVIGQRIGSVLITSFAAIPAFIAGVYAIESCDCDDDAEPIEPVAEPVAEPVPSEPVKRGRCGRPYSQCSILTCGCKDHLAG